MAEYPDLIKAIWANKPGMVQRLLDNGVPVDTLDPDGRTALMESALSEDRLVFVRILLSHGAKVDAADPAGWTALHFAAQASLPETVELLLSHCASPDPQDCEGNTPLFRAVFNSDGSGEVIELLRAAGADPHLTNNHGQSPVGLARLIANYDVAKFFADLP